MKNTLLIFFTLVINILLANNNSQFISQTTPSSIQAGQSFTTTVIFKNTGTTTWIASSSYSLGTEYSTWSGTSRIALPNNVAPGEQISFNINLTAPSTEGMHIIQWRMVQDGVEWFGNFSDAVYFPIIPVTSDTLLTNGNMFSVNNHIVSTSFFGWYGQGEWQVNGPWIPIDGRNSWNGSIEYWKTMIKETMYANIDVLYIELIPLVEQSRGNLFLALNQLRASGWNVPKVCPFLDPEITYPILGYKADCSTEAGKDELISHYIKFYKEYYIANTDQYADDFIYTQDGHPVLNTWHIQLNINNYNQLTRNDITSRFSEEFGSEHPIFNNQIKMINNAISPSYSFADERVHQFEVHQYKIDKTHNEIKSTQVKAGYWDKNVRVPGMCLPRDGGTHYTSAWNSINADPSIDRVYVESFNEYDEGSGIFAAKPDTIYKKIDGGMNNTSNDLWSATNDPYEYIKTTALGAAKFNDDEQLNAKILWNNIPSTMLANETFTATVVVRNAGNEQWNAANNFKFGEIENLDATSFGIGRYLMNDNEDEIPIYKGIFRGRAKTFNIEITAPSTPGIYSTHWTMLKEGTAWFGDTLIKQITVNSATDIEYIKNEFIAQTVPSAVTPNETFNISLTYKNTGSKTWIIDSLYHLASQNQQNNNTWGINLVNLPDSVPYNQEVTFNFNITAPSNEGIYDFQWQMLLDSTEWFGEKSNLFAISVVNNVTTIDASTLNNKVMFGYQGWFTTPDDGATTNPWHHYFDGGNNQIPVVDFWPDITEFDDNELFDTGLLLPDGSAAKVPSAYTLKTVKRHMKWLADYELDGIFLQRFVNELEDSRYLNFRNQVLNNVMLGAEDYGRTFAVMYDISSGENINRFEKIKQDWIALVDFNIIASPNYLNHNDLPVVSVWGIGFNHHGYTYTAAEAADLIDFFQNNPNPAYRATVMGGIPTYWRQRINDSETEAAWQDVYESLDIISPWSVNRYTDNNTADNFKNNLIHPDKLYIDNLNTNGNNISYLPVIWPGFSWGNLQIKHGQSPIYNEVPRNKGEFFWKQAYNVIDEGVNMIYIAMFDEIDEGTAMFKCATTQDKVPTPTQFTGEQQFISLDVDEHNLESDYYLKLAGCTGKVLRGETELTTELPTCNTTSGNQLNLSTSASCSNSGSITVTSENSGLQTFYLYNNAEATNEIANSGEIEASSYEFTNLASGEYYAKVEDNVEVSDISSIILTNLTNTAITSQPNSTTAILGNNVTLSVSAEGENLSYVWKFNNNTIESENNSTLELTDVNTYNDGEYSVIVSGDCGNSDTSSVATLTITEPINQVNNSATFISQTIPSTVAINQTFNGSITYKNTGNNTWSLDSEHRIGSQGPQDNINWGPNRINLTSEVLPNQEVTFTYNFTAPSTVGTYNFQWKMVQDGVEWFGDLSQLSTILVVENIDTPLATTTTTPACLNQGSITVTSNLSCAQTYYLYADATATNEIANSGEIIAANYMFTNLASGNYYVRIENNGVLSNIYSATITSLISTEIISSPNSITANADENVSFSVNAIGENLSYVWKFNNNTIESENNNTLELTAINTNNNGNYSVIVSGDCGNSVTSSIATLTVIEPLTLTASFTVSKNELCANTENIISYTGTVYENSLYNWDFNGGVIISGEAQGPYVIKWETEGAKTISLHVQSDLLESSANSSITVNPLPKIILPENVSICNGNSISLTASISSGTPEYNYLWSQGSQTNTITVNPTNTTTYSLTVTDNKACTVTASSTVNLNNVSGNQKICIVLVDSIENKNLIVWDKSSDEGIVSYNIYGRNGADYSLIGNVPFSNKSEFSDISSTPSINAEQYKISSIDICGNESELSYYHQTMHLSIASGLTDNDVVLIWNKYIDESLEYTPDFYYIYRGTDANNMILHDQVSGYLSSFNYNITNALPGERYYISINKDNCTANDKSISELYTKSISNITFNKDIANTSNNALNQISIFPNPTSGLINIDFGNLSNISIKVFNILGNVVYQKESINSFKYKFILNEKSGIYFIEASSDNTKQIFKIIKE